MNVENNPLSFLKTGTILYPLKTEGNTKVMNQGISPQGNMEQGMGVFQNLLLKSLQSGMESKSGAGNPTDFEEPASEIPDEILEEAGMSEFIHPTLTQMPVHRMEMETITTPAGKGGTDSLVIETEELSTDSLVVETEELSTGFLVIETEEPSSDNLVSVKPVAEVPEPNVKPEAGPRPESVAKDLNPLETIAKERPDPSQSLWKSMEKEDRVSFLKETARNGIETAMLRNEKQLNPEEMGINPNMKVAPGNGVTEMQMPEAKVEKPAVYNQIANEIESAIKKEGPMEFTVKLNPKELGGVDIRIKMMEGKLSIDIMADRQETHNLLSSQVEKLTSRLGMQNYQVETIQLNPTTNATNLNLSGQGFPMNFAMDFSNKRHQEKMKDKSGTKIDSLSTADLSIPEVQATQKNGLEKMKFDSHRINYSV